MKPRLACLLVVCMPVACLLPAIAAGQTVTLKQGGEAVRIAVGDAAALPADFPKDVPLPEPHAIVRVQSGDGTTSTLMLEAPLPVDEAARRFRAGMLAQGWTAASVRAPAAGQAQAWEKSGRAVVAWLQPSPDGMRMQLQLLRHR
jgi:hypothetical protein